MNRLAGKPVGLVEQPEFQVHASGLHAQPRVGRREFQRPGHLGDRFRLFAPLPEHIGVVPSGIDVDGAVFHRLFQQALGPREIITIRRRQPLVAQPAGIGELGRHRPTTADEAATRSTGCDQDRNAQRQHGGGEALAHRRGR